MTLKLHHLRPAPGAKTAKTRVGRGEGSKGKTAGRGTKGTKARNQVPASFEGGQMPIHMRLPKLKGFKNPFKVEFQVVNLDRISELFPEGGAVAVDDLVAKGAVRDGHPVKVLGQGDISVAVAGRARTRSPAPPRRRSRPPAAPPPCSDRSMTERWGADGTVSTGAAAPRRTTEGPRVPVRLPRVSRGSSARAAPRLEKEDLVLGAFANAFRTPDLRRKLLFVLLIIVIFRLGSQVPAPGVNVANVQACLNDVQDQGIYGLINLFSGGALLQLTIFALGIMPYITASIILQLLVVVIPRLEALKKEGQAGQTKITQYTRYLTLGLAILQATGIVALARSGNLLQGCERGPAPQRRHRHVPGHGHHHDRRHRRDHVARRADHRARHRQRHVDPDLHPGRRDLPRLAVGRSRRARAGGSSAS